MDFPGGSVVNNQPANAEIAREGDSNSGLRRSPGEGNDNPLQFSCLGNPMDKGDSWAIGFGVANSSTPQQLSTT